MRGQRVQRLRHVGQIGHAAVRKAQGLGQQRKVGRVQVGIDAPAAVLGVLDVLDHAVGAVVHQHDGQVSLLLHRAGQLAQVQHKAAVTAEQPGAPAAGVGGRTQCRAYAHGQAQADAAAHRMHAGQRVEQAQLAVAPGAVGQRHVARPDEVPAHARLQRVHQRRIRAQAVAQAGAGAVVGAPQVTGEGRVHLHTALRTVRRTIRRTALQAALQSVRQAGQRQRGVGTDELLVGVAPAVGRGVGIDAQQRLRQLQLVFQGLVAAQPRAHHQQRIATAVEGLDGGLQGVGAQRGRVVLGQHAPALGGGDHTKAQRHQPGHRSARLARAAAQPQQRPAAACQRVGQAVQRGSVGRGHQRGRCGQAGVVVGQGYQRGLDVDGQLHADRPAWRAEGAAHGILQGGQRGVGTAHPPGPLGHRLQHRQLVGRLVDVGQVAVEVGRLDLPGDVQQWRAGGQGLDQAAGGIASGGAGAGDHHAQRAGAAGAGVGHAGGAGLTPGRHEADGAALGDGVQDRHVVDGDHAEGHLDAAALQEGGDGMANGDGACHGVRQLEGGAALRVRHAGHGRRTNPARCR